MKIIKENKVILIVIILIISILIWSGMANTGGDSLLSQRSATQNRSVDDRELLQLLTDMRNIRLEGHIFESPAYLQLQDFGRSIVPEPVGRDDPFAPIPTTEITVSGGGDPLQDQVLLR